MNKTEFDFRAIKIIRKMKGVTLPDLAKRAGISKGYLSQLENGLCSEPTLKMLLKISNAMKLDFFDFLKGLTV